MGFKTADYDAIIEKLKKVVEIYKKVKFYHNKYTLYLANGDIITIKTPKKSISHLLGVDTDYIESLKKVNRKCETSYDVLNDFLDDTYTYSPLSKTGKEVNHERMFSKHIKEKLDVFLDNIQFRSDDVEYVVKYDRERTYQTGEASDICDYYIIRKIKGNYAVLGIVKDATEAYNNVYVPVTSRKYDNHIDLENFISRIAKKQELTYIYKNRIVNHDQDYNNIFHMYDDRKKFYAEKIDAKAKKFDATASVINEFTHALSRLGNQKSNNDQILATLKLLSDNIKSGHVLDDETVEEELGSFELPSELKEIINLWNDTLCSNKELSGGNSEYSKVVKENKELKERNSKLSSENIVLKGDNNKLENRNKELEEQNNLNNEKLDEIQKVYQKVFK